MKLLSRQLDRNDWLKNERKEICPYTWWKEITKKFDPQMDQTLTMAERPNIRTDLALMFSQKKYFSKDKRH